MRIASRMVEGTRVMFNQHKSPNSVQRAMGIVEVNDSITFST